MKKLLLLSAGFVLAAGSAFAALTADQLVSAYRADGFSAIEVVTGATQIKVEAVKAGTRLEVVYDTASGAILKQEQRPARAKEIADTSTEIGTRPGDFILASGHDVNDDHGGGNDDGPGHDLNDDHGGDRDDDSSDDGSGHDANDDHGGDRDKDRSGSGRGGSDDRDDDNSGHGGGDDDGDED